MGVYVAHEVLDDIKERLGIACPLLVKLLNATITNGVLNAVDADVIPQFVAVVPLNETLQETGFVFGPPVVGQTTGALTVSTWAPGKMDPRTPLLLHVYVF